MRAKRLIDSVAQIFDMYVNQIAPAVDRAIPGIIEQRGPTVYLVGVEHHQLQDAEFFVTQRNSYTLMSDDMRYSIQ